MLSKEEQEIKKRILNTTKQEKIIEIYKNENITMNIVNDLEVQAHISKYVETEEGNNHIYIRNKENATKEYLDYANKYISDNTYQ